MRPTTPSKRLFLSVFQRWPLVALVETPASCRSCGVAATAAAAVPAAKVRHKAAAYAAIADELRARTHPLGAGGQRVADAAASLRAAHDAAASRLQHSFRAQQIESRLASVRARRQKRTLRAVTRLQAFRRGLLIRRVVVALQAEGTPLAAPRTPPPAPGAVLLKWLRAIVTCGCEF